VSAKPGQLNQTLTAIWTELLGAPPSAAANFFEAGGQSITLVRLMCRIRDDIGVAPELPRFLQTPTFESLEAQLAERTPVRDAPSRPPRASPHEGRLSTSQQRFWFLEQLRPGTARFHVPFTVALDGPIDRAAMQRAFGMLVARHALLRAHFRVVGAEVRQFVAASPTARLSIVDLTGLPDAAARATAARQAQRIAAAVFTLEQSAARFALFTVRHDAHLLAVTMHHIVSDHRSAEVLLDEWAALYTAVLRRQAPGLPDPVQYADVIEAEAQRVAPDHEDVERLARALRAPTFTPAAIPTRDGAATAERVRVEVPSTTRETLVSVGRARGATLFMVVTAAFEVLLSRYIGQQDFSLGVVVSTRDATAHDTVVGPFVNTMPLACRVPPRATFAEQVVTVRGDVLEAITHRHLPFDRLVDQIAPTPGRGAQPMFRTLVISQERRGDAALDFGGVKARVHDAFPGAVPNDLVLTVVDAQPDLSLYLDFETGTYDRAFVEELAQSFVTLLESAATKPDARGGDLALLSPSQRRAFFAGSVGPHAPVPDEELHHAIESQAAATPDAVALVCGDGHLSYGELDRRASAFGARLRSTGIGPEAIVGVVLERGADLLIVILGILKSGAAYLPLDPKWPRARVHSVLTDARAAAVIAQSMTRSLVDGGTTPVILADDGQAPPEAARPTPRIARLGSHLAYVIYTSGSTGQPKGVAVEHRQVRHFFAAMDRRLGTSPQVWLAATTVTFDISILELLWPLTHGSRVVITIDRAPAPVPLFSLFFFAADEDGQTTPYSLLLQAARWADQHGFAAVWTPERHFHRFGGTYPNPAITSAALAAVTTRIGIRAGSVVLPLHNPLRVAEEWAAVDNLSGGRVGVAFASGWHPSDFVLAPERYADRRRVLRDHVSIVRRLWRGEHLPWPGPDGHLVDVQTRPRPVQPELPTWVTASSSPATFALAGELGAHVLTHLLGQTFDELEANIRTFRQAWSNAGHPGRGQVTVMVHAFVTDDAERARQRAHDPFTSYLKGSFDLAQGAARSAGIDVTHAAPDDVEALVARAQERFLNSSTLVGSPRSCLELVIRLRDLGVDEIAGLIDFGVDEREVLESLPYLAQLRELAAGMRVERPPSIADHIRRYAVTHFQCTPSMAALLDADLDPDTEPRLATLVIGGEELPARLASRLRRAVSGQIFNAYGPTETTIWSAVRPLSVDEGDAGVAIGDPLLNSELWVLNEHLAPLPVGVVGELYLGGAGVARGYAGRPELTADRFIPNPFSAQPGSRLYRTGDRVRRRPDGAIDFLGRADDQVKLAGHRIEPAEIRAAINSHPLVHDSAVWLDAFGDGARLIAFVVPSRAPQRAAPRSAPRPGASALARCTLPNGLTVAHFDRRQTNGLYKELFEDRRCLQHGIDLPPGATIFDVGANIGLFTLQVLQEHPDASVFAFEPMPRTFEILQANTEGYGAQVRLSDYAVGSRAGTDQFAFYPQLAALSGRHGDRDARRAEAQALVSLSSQAAAIASTDAPAPAELQQLLDARYARETIDRPVTTLAAEIARHRLATVDLLKIDVEGAELDVLNGIGDENWPRIRQVVVEAHSTQAAQEIAGILHARGFTVATDNMVDIHGAESDGVHVSMITARRLGVNGTPSSVSPDAQRDFALTPDALRAFVARRLPAYMVPSHCVIGEELPLLPSGKLDRVALQRQARREVAVTRAHVAPRSMTEALVAEVFAQVLGRPEVGLSDNFFELGGHSLLALEALLQLRERSGCHLPLQSVFDTDSVSELAAVIDAIGRLSMPPATAPSVMREEIEL
jgi:natural product biosynthesis luciferase-like monooxygenase protein/FkbM family methyltransferase